MQRYHAASCSSAVNNSALSGSVRDSRVESSSIAPNYSLNSSRRPLQLTPYKLKCDKDSLNTRLGPPDFHPQSPHCAEETLPKEYVLSGYKEAVEGLEEGREISLSQVPNFTKPVIARCREALRKYHRAINESRAQKRKAGQVYGVPLSSNLLTKPCIFPDQRPCGEEFRKKWIEGLSQRHKRLCTLADHVPHGYRRKSLFEVLIRNNVPLLRATWFIKITYLNQVRPGSSSFSTGLPDRTQISRSEQWTKDIIDYLQGLLDEFLVRNNSFSTVNFRDRSPQVAGVGSMLHQSDTASAALDGEEPSLHFKWWYVVRILQWHHSEGLIIPSLIIDWVFHQLQEKQLLGVLQLLLPVIYGVIGAVVLCQTYVRTLVGIAIRYIQEPSPGGSDLVDNSRRAYTISALVEMLRHLIFIVPDAFVAFDCFPLPSCVVNQLGNDGNFLLKVGEQTSKRNKFPSEIACLHRDRGTECQFDSVNSLRRVVSSIQKCAETLARAARPGYPGQNFAKVLQALDKSLAHGDLSLVYKVVFESLCDGAIGECWISEVSSCLRSTLTYIGGVSLPLICSVFLICEWATCDFRDFRAAPPSGQKFSGRKDISQIYIAMRLLKVKNRELQRAFQCKNESTLGVDGLVKDPEQLNILPEKNFAGSNYDLMLNSKHEMRKDISNIFGSPSPLHDIIVCWIDQHQVQSEGGVKRLQLFIVELIRAGIFYPQAYVRQILVSGIMDSHGVPEYERRKRHHRILKQLPSPYVRDALEEAEMAEETVLSEVMNIYSNERRLVLHGLVDHPSSSGVSSYPDQKRKFHHSSGNGSASPSLFDQSRSPYVPGLTKKKVDRVMELEYLKSSITALLQLPGSSVSCDSLPEDFTGSNKRSFASYSNKLDIGEGTPGCEECRKVKRQKLSEDRNSNLHRYSPNLLEDEEIWWVRKGQKSMESCKVDPPKPAKQAGRGRQKVVRKTQSLAQLAASRIEGSQGASSSHVCDNKIVCPHHRSGAEGDAPKPSDGIKTPCGDLISIRRALKKMRFVEKRKIISWMVAGVKQLIEDAGRTTTKAGQYGRPSSTAGDRNAVRWKLGEDELSYILYLMDISCEIVSAVRFLLWLLPKAVSSATSIHGVRNILLPPRNSDNLICEVGEAFLISSIRRYENIIAAADLFPETLSAAMHRVTITMASTGRISGSAALAFARHLWKRYSNVASVVEWEKNAKSTYDKRLMSELESGRLSDGEFGFPLGVPAGVEDLDDFFRQKISGVRVSRVGLTMQRQIDEVFRKIYGPGLLKNSGAEKLDDGHQTAQQIVMGLMDCMRQTGGAAQEGDPSLVSSAIAAIFSSVGQVIARIPDLFVSNNHHSLSLTSNPLSFARRILRIHVLCLCLLKDALGERQSRVFEVALATEACNVLVQVFIPGKGGPRSQFQMSPDSHDSIPNSSDVLNNLTKVALGRTAKITGAISALVIGTILQGITNLERLVCLLRLREGLDPIQFLRSIKSNSNGNTRSIGTLKQDSLVEVSVHWFRVLVGNCRTVSDGFIVDLLGEVSVITLSRMQRALPVNLVFPPAYTMFAFVKWKGFILNCSVGAREDFPQMYQSLMSAIGDAIKHLPFREVCLRDTHALYDLIAADPLDSEFAVFLDSSGSDLLPKAAALVPLRARLFLNALVDCKLPQSVLKQDDGNRMYGQGESRADEVKEKLVHVLDTLQPAKFHWQWVELRLLLNEQAVIEKLEAHDTSLVEAVRSVSPNPEKVVASENENNFVEIILTRLLVRPDAAPLFSEVVHLLGRSLEDSMLLQTKWFLGGNDVLYGRKSIRQRLINIAESKNLSTRLLHWKPWGWCSPGPQPLKTKGNKRKLEVNSVEEGIDDAAELRLPGRGSMDAESLVFNREHVTERAFIELILPCVDQGSDDSRSTFASDMIKQMNNIEQQISTVTRGATKSSGSVTPGIESLGGKSNSRKGLRGGSPGLVRRPVGASESVPPSPAALRASLSLRLQFLLRLLPIIWSDRELSVRNMRYTLAAVILRLIGSRVVHEDAGNTFSSFISSSKRDADSLMEAFATASVVSCGESLFDRLLLVLHGLLSSCPPSWLKFKAGLRSTSESCKEFSTLDRELVENLQTELDRMQLPDSVRWRIQTAMPVLCPAVRSSISCQPPFVSPASLGILQSSNPISVVQACNSVLPQRNPASLLRTVTSSGAGKAAKPPQQEPDIEADPWTVLEDGSGAQSSSNSTVSGGSDHSNLRALNWLKGTVRVRRSELSYIGAVDEDS